MKTSFPIFLLHCVLLIPLEINILSKDLNLMQNHIHVANLREWQIHYAQYNRVQRSSLPTHAPSLKDMRGQNELLMVSLRCLMENVFLRLTSPSLLVILLRSNHTCVWSYDTDTIVIMTVSMMVKYYKDDNDDGAVDDNRDHHHDSDNMMMELMIKKMMMMMMMVVFKPCGADHVVSNKHKDASNIIYTVFIMKNIK